MSKVRFGAYTPRDREDLMQGNEVRKPIKERQFFNSCYVTDANLHDGNYAVTVVASYDLKRYMETLEPLGNDKIFRELDIIAVGLDGNGIPRFGWHEKQLFEEVKTQHYKDGERMDIMDSIMGTGTTLVTKKVSMSSSSFATTDDKPIMSGKQKANHENLTDNIFNENKLLFGVDKEINLDNSFVSVIKEIGKFTRENDTTFPHAIMNEKMQDFDNIRTAVGLISSILPITKAYKMAQTLTAYLADAFSGSALVIPASDLYNLRGPVNLSKVTYELYDSNPYGGYTKQDHLTKTREDISILY